MLLFLTVWSVFMAFCLAKLEINIEGKYGWAEKLPTWRMKNWLTDLFLTGAPLTGYHFWQFSIILLYFHFPFVIGVTWKLALELQILGIYFLFLAVEDFLWFVMNPYYGIQKFRKENVWWHTRWIGRIPIPYIKTISTSILLLVLSQTLA